jgi:hypothetical protein
LPCGYDPARDMAYSVVFDIAKTGYESFGFAALGLIAP